LGYGAAWGWPWRQFWRAGTLALALHAGRALPLALELARGAEILLRRLRRSITGRRAHVRKPALSQDPE
jgi:hypothetical protein